jgi:hypothetical protein
MTLLRTTLSCVTAALLLASGCATSGPVSASPKVGGRPSAWLKTELYMGAVEPDAWRDFLEKNVTPRFPAGFTVYEAYGQWRSPQGEIRSLPSRVLVILHPPDAASESGIEAIRNDFKDRFHHVSVLRATAAAQVAF